ncbi:hypothetical protein AC579_5025 [Pseudocercospora musae]|uniref:Uncharacterized protein n=1 Tax=Pseudocercospora musae TaxID=113226 RepID=A0A139IAJ0_9PEZI|nr:hypothetical protein AC579_5025 [Pseudocercospora musae]
MASTSTATPSSTSHPYSYQKPSTMATRTLISGSKPPEAPTSGSHDHDDTPDKPTLQRKTTSNYQDAVAAAGTADEVSRPALQRAQGSYSRSDYKRGVMEQTLAGSPHSPHGYTSTSEQATAQ